MTCEVKISYFAILRDQRGVSEEVLSFNGTTPQELYSHLQEKFGLTFKPENLRVAVNDSFAPWNTSIKNGDRVAFIPPVSGG
jgi:sulfur-carrier protein